MRVCQFRHFGPNSVSHNTFRACQVKPANPSRTAPSRPTGAPGLVLRGTEVKALRAGLVNFKDAYATVRNGEAWLLGCHISPYSHGTDANHDPERDRKLLLPRREIARLTGKLAERGLTLGPLRLYF